MGPPPMPGSPRSPKSPRRSGGSSPFVQTAMEISPALVLAVVAALAALAVGALDLTHEVTLGIDLGTTYSVAATCDKGEVSVVVDDAIGSMGAVGGDAATVPSVVHFERPAFALARDEWRSKRWGEFGSRVGTKRELNERKREFKSRREVKSANDAAVVEVGSVVGAEAAALRDAVPALTVYDAKRLIGREFDDPVVQEELEHLPFHVVENHNQPRPRDVAIGATMQGKALPYKRLMPSDRANLVVIPPEEVGARILSHLKRHSERSLPFFRRNLGFAFGSLTVSVPVGFTKAQRAATLRAANRAGFATARLLEEPVAAAIAYGLHEDDVERTVLVYDLGGGTLDVAVLRLERSSRTFLVLGTSGDPHLGGEDFDRALVGWLWRELRTDGFRAPADDDDGRWEETALRVMERAKRGLAESERVGVRACGDEDAYPTRGETEENDKAGGRTVSLAHLRLLPVDDDSDDSKEEGSTEEDSKEEDSKEEDPSGLVCTTRWLTRDDLATSCAKLVDRAMAPVLDALHNAGNVDPDEIDDVVIVGGSSRLAVIRQRLSEAFHGRDVHHTVNPDTAIAVGAARSYAC